MAHEASLREDWILIHEQLSRLARVRTALDFEEGQWLLRAAREGVHQHFGLGSVFEYAERVLGYKPRSTDEKLRVAAALEGLPELAGTLQQGTLSWSAVRELSRVATPDTERAWITAAQGKTVRQVERMVSRARTG